MDLLIMSSVIFPSLLQLYAIALAYQEEQSDLGLHCLPRPVCQETKDHYGVGQPEASVTADSHGMTSAGHLRSSTYRSHQFLDNIGSAWLT